MQIGETVCIWYNSGPERGQKCCLSLLLGSDSDDLGLEATVAWRAMMTCLQPCPAPFKAASSLSLRLGFSHLLSKPLATLFLPAVCLQPFRNPCGHTVLLAGSGDCGGAGTQGCRHPGPGIRWCPLAIFPGSSPLSVSPSQPGLHRL